jgi:hypothetical protein
MLGSAYAYRIPIEEAALAAPLGEPYRQYASRACRLVPFFSIDRGHMISRREFIAGSVDLAITSSASGKLVPAPEPIIVNDIHSQLNSSRVLESSSRDF